MENDDLTRRDFVSMTVAAGLAAAAAGADLSAQQVTETNVEIKTPDGTCDAAFIHPASGAHPAVIIWPDAFGLRTSMRDMAKRLAIAGYTVLVPNPFYRVGGKAQVGQQVRGVAEGERQYDAALLELQAVHAWHEHRPGIAQLRGERRELRVGRMQHGEVLRAERVLFHRDEVQARAAARVLAPGLPRGEKGEAEAEARLEDGEARRARPALRQAVAAQEDVLRLREAALRAVVEVAVVGRERRAVVGVGEARGGQDLGHRHDSARRRHGAL